MRGRCTSPAAPKSCVLGCCECACCWGGSGCWRFPVSCFTWSQRFWSAAQRASQRYANPNLSSRFANPIAYRDGAVIKGRVPGLKARLGEVTNASSGGRTPQGPPSKRPAGSPLRLCLLFAGSPDGRVVRPHRFLHAGKPVALQAGCQLLLDARHNHGACRRGVAGSDAPSPCSEVWATEGADAGSAKHEAASPSPRRGPQDATYCRQRAAHSGRGPRRAPNQDPNPSPAQLPPPPS